MMRAVPSSVIGRIPAAVPSSVPAVPTVPSPIPSPIPTVIRVVSRIPTPRRAPSPPPRAAPVPCGGAPSPQSEIDVYVGCSPVAVQGGGVFGFYEHLVAEDRHVVIGRIVGGGIASRGVGIFVLDVALPVVAQLTETFQTACVRISAVTARDQAAARFVLLSVVQFGYGPGHFLAAGPFGLFRGALRFLLPDETLLLLGGDRFPVVRYV